MKTPKVINLLKRVFEKFKHSIELSKYNEFTIAEYFRRQGAQIGEECYIVPRTLGTEPYLVKIGNHVTIGPSVKFVTHDGGPWIFRKDSPDLKDIQVFGPIVIEDNCVIGLEAILFPNIKIGPNSIVGAGSVVIKDVPANTIVMGVPARPFGSIEKYKEKCIARWEAQRPRNFSAPAGASAGNGYREMIEGRRALKKHLLELYSNELTLEKK